MRYRYFFILFIIAAAIIIISSQIEEKVAEGSANSSDSSSSGKVATGNLGSGNVGSAKGSAGKKAWVEGMVYRATWNKVGQFVFYPKEDANKGNVLIDGINLSEDTRGILENGGMFEMEDYVTEPPESRNFDEFDYKMYLKAKGITGIARPSEGKILICAQQEGKMGAGIWRVWAARVRNKIREVFNENLSEGKSALMMALLTGDTGLLEQDTKDDMRRSGLSHLMAVSGGNVVLALVPFKLLTRSKHLSIRNRRIILLVPLVAFGMMTDFTPSITRAVVMTGYGIVAEILNRDSDGLNALGLAGLIQIGINPWSIFDAGFILSFGAVFSMMLLTPSIEGGFRKIGIRKPPMILVSGLAVQLGLLPIMAALFNQISLIGLVLNLVACPLATYACFAGIILAITGSLAIPIPLPLPSYIATAITFLLEQTAHISTFIPFSSFSVASPKLPVIVCYYGILALMLFYRHARKSDKWYPVMRRMIGFACCALIFAGIGCTWFVKNAPQVDFLDVGQGDSAVIYTSGGTVGLVDAGPGNTDVSSILFKKGIGTIDFVVATHGHSDHIAGMVQVFLQHKVKYLIIPDSPSDAALQGLAVQAKASGSKILVVQAGDILPIDSKNSIEILSGGSLGVLPEGLSTNAVDDTNDAESADINNTSLVFKLVMPLSTVLFTGDAQQEIDQALCSRDDLNLKCDILKVAHHGSPTSSTAKLLEQINPGIAVISVGRNSYGHPSPDVLQHLKTQGAQAFRTDQSGGIKIYFTNAGGKILTKLPKSTS